MRPEEKLYDLLAGDKDIPWVCAAEEFIRVKVASGGLYPDEAPEVCKIIVAAAEAKKVGTPAPQLSDPAKKALEQGVLSGLRSIPSGDISAMARARRTRATRIGEVLGLAGGGGAGLLAARGASPTAKVLAAALGATGGKTLGRALGTEVDAARVRAMLQGKAKSAEIEKQAETVGEQADKPSWTPTATALTGMAAGGVGGHLYGKHEIGHVEKKVLPALIEGMVERGTAGKAPTAAEVMLAQHVAKGTKKGTKAAVKQILLGRTGYGPRGHRIVRALQGLALGGAALGGGHLLLKRWKEQRAAREQEKTSSVQRILEIMQKLAQRPGADPVITSPVAPMPAESPLIGEAQAPALHPAIEQQLDQLQQRNEVDFYAEEATKAKEEADAGKQRIEELVSQINMLNQYSQSQMAQDQQIRQIAEQNAQASQQDAMSARDESLQAQQQNLALRNSVTQFRQALMNLISQDPTQAVPPPTVPTGPAPGAPGAPPVGPEGMAPSAPPEAVPPGPEAGMAPAPSAPPPAATGALAPPGVPEAPKPMEPPPPPAAGAAPAPAAG